MFPPRHIKLFVARGLLFALLVYFIPLALCPYACLGDVCPWSLGAASNSIESSHGGCCDPGHEEGSSTQANQESGDESPSACGACDDQLTTPVQIFRLSTAATDDFRRLDIPLTLAQVSADVAIERDPPHLRTPLPDQLVSSREPSCRPTGRAPPLA